MFMMVKLLSNLKNRVETSSSTSKLQYLIMRNIYDLIFYRKINVKIHKLTLNVKFQETLVGFNSSESILGWTTNLYWMVK